MTEVGTTDVSTLMRWGGGYELSVHGGDGFGNSVNGQGAVSVSSLCLFAGSLLMNSAGAILGVDTKSALTSPFSSPSQPSPREPQTSAEHAC